MLSTKMIPIKPIPVSDNLAGGEKCVGHTSSSVNQEQALLLSKARDLNAQAQIRLKQAQQEADEVLNKAQQEADELLAKVREDAFTEGYREGFQVGESKGLESGHESAMKQLTAEMDLVKNHWFMLNQKIEDELNAMSPDLIHLMIQCLEKLTHQVFEESELKIMPMIQEIILDLAHRQRIFIRVSTQMKVFLEPHLQELKDYCPAARLQLFSDATLEEFDCFIETEIEQINLKLDHRLEVLKDALLQVV